VLLSAYVNILEALASVRGDRDFEEEVRWVRQQILTEPELKTVEKGGAVEPPTGGQLNWDVKVESMPVADVFSAQLHLEYRRQEPSGEKLRKFDETMVLLRPSWSEPVERGKIFEEAKQRIESSRRMVGTSAKSSEKTKRK
jgi:hypothetical protein